MTEVRPQPRRRVSEVMGAPPIMVDAEATVADAAEVLHDEQVGAVLVGSPDDLLGVLSERDVVDVVARGGDPRTTPVRQAMTASVIRVEVDDTILDAAVEAVDIGVRHLPVMDGGLVAGVVSTRDLVLPLLLGALVGEP
jgi:signal-transduction protein with cAMP-binding, CBS, and nucleotidyltransferase domain